MLAFSVKILAFSLPKFSFHLHFHCSLRLRSFSRTHVQKLAQNDSQILFQLHNHRLQEARNLLDRMSQRGRHNRIVHWTSLLSKYTKYGFVDEARTLFDIMPERNIVTYNTMLAGYAQCGRFTEACRLFEEMQDRNVVSWTLMLSVLFDSGRDVEAKRLFYEIPQRNVVSWNVMIVALIRNGELEEARRVFDAMPVRNVISWNIMISGYAENYRIEDAKVMFEEMDERNVVTWTSMIAGYCRGGDVSEAYYLFRRMPERNVISWTAMIGGFAWNGFSEEALFLFLEMKGNTDTRPNGETFMSLAYACGCIRFPRLGKQVHAQVIVNGMEFDDYDGRLSRSLIHMYSSFSIMDYSRYLFNKHSCNCVVQSINSMINGYIRIGQLEEAQDLFDTVPVRDKISWTSMVDGYLGVGDVPRARSLFNNMPNRDAVAWTAMISGLVQNELFAEATYLFLKMRADGFSPLSSTYSVLFGAAGATANLDEGMQLHCMLLKTWSKFDLILGNSLISMYAKCGVIDDAYTVFSEMEVRDLISWNSMIMGFSHHGLANEALRIYEGMLKSGTYPNSVTFLAILSAFSHAGLVNQGLELFNVMNDVYIIQPSVEHYVCMVNLLGRAGKVKEAEDFVLKLPFEPNKAIWGALLGVCGFGDTNAEVAKRAAEKFLQLEPLNAPVHVLLCNIYSFNGQHVEEQKLRKEMRLKGVRKLPGCSWIWLNGKAEAFVSGDMLHPQASQILSLLMVDE